MAESPERVDVLIVGAGLSGIAAAFHLQREFPLRRCLVVEARDDLGGTWDIFRYPGVRSDSDMFTLGYRSRPWLGDKVIADGRSVLEYLRRTAAETGVERLIRFGHRVVHAEWSSSEQRWTVGVRRGSEDDELTITATFLFCCSGYYRCESGFVPKFTGLERFAGDVVHPQEWPEGLDVSGKQVVVIGSGATAVTLAPALAREGAQVTLVQRSPSYVLPVPTCDRLADLLRRALPIHLANRLMRGKFVTANAVRYFLCQRYPTMMKAWIRRRQRRLLPPGYDADIHFEPRYNPWDQRLCLAADGDFFKAIRKGSLRMVTDRIETFTEAGLRLRSGADIFADIVVTATGLELLPFGGIDLRVDGEAVDFAERLAYKSMMLSDVPNFVYCMGYVNASWTLKAELVCEWVIRLLRHLDAKDYTSATPAHDPSVTRAPFQPNFTPGYFLRSGARFPSRGDRKPWNLPQNYVRDVPILRYGRLDDGVLRFTPKSWTCLSTRPPVGPRR